MFKSNKQDICIIDFGLAKYYKINNEHVPFSNMDVIRVSIIAVQI